MFGKKKLTIEVAESKLGCTFPDIVRELYHESDEHDTHYEQQGLLGRLSLEQVITLHTPDKTGYIPAWWRKFGLVAFWEDYNSNYFAVRVEEPLIGMVAFLDHEDNSPAPKYRTVDAFLEHMAAGIAQDEDWYEWPTDLPLPETITEEEAAARTYFWSQIDRASEDDQVLWFDSGAHLVSKSEVELLVPYLDSDNMWIQEIATELISKGESPNVMSYMKRMACEGMHNAQFAATLAIDRLVGPEAISILEQLAEEAEPQKAEYIRRQIKFFERRRKKQQPKQ